MVLLYALVHNDRVYKDRISLHDLSDNKIMKFTRLPRHVVKEICHVLEPSLKSATRRSHALPVETQVLAGLRFLGTGSFQWVIGHSTGMSQSSVHKSVLNTVNALANLVPYYINFPRDRIKLNNNKQQFAAVDRFPNVVGAVDCTRINLRTPTEREDIYVNRKGRQPTVYLVI